MDTKKLVDQYEKPDFDDSGASKYSITQHRPEDLIKGYEALVLQTQCDNGLSSVIEPSVMQAFDNSNHDAFIRFARDDCKEKAKDVRGTNRVAQGVPAFMSIMVLIDFLSKCAFKYNKSAALSNGRVRTSDEVRFAAFVNKYLLSANGNAYLSVNTTDGLAGVLYKMVRCGLIHGETLSHEDPKFSNIRITISHSHGGEKTLADLDSLIRAGEQNIVLNAWVLCDAIDKAIDDMFSGNEQGVLSSIVEAYRTEPPIIFLKPPRASNASFTLYWVTKETREDRSQRIRDIFAKEPAWGYLMAVFDFEWTIRRAIVLMNPCPTAIIKKVLEDDKASGLGAYHKCWEKYVRRARNDSTSRILDIVFDNPHDMTSTKDKIRLLNEAMMLRHRLVHGVSGSIPATEADSCFERVLQASEKISAYVNSHSMKGMNDRVTRRLDSCKTCCKTKHCPFKTQQQEQQQKAKARAVKDKERRSKKA